MSRVRHFEQPTKFVLMSLLLAACGLVSGCSLLSTRNRKAAPVQKDVPFNARSSEGDLRKRLYVLPFNDGTGRQLPDKTLELARNAFLAGLRKSDGYLVLALSELPGDLSQWRRQGDFDLSAVAKNLAALGASAVVEGKIMEIRARRLSDEVGLMRTVKAQVEASVRLRVWGVRNDKELLNELRKAQIESTSTRFAKQSFTDRELEEDPKLISEVIAKAFAGSSAKVQLALQKINWQGRIAAIKGEKIYLNAGRLSGLQVGDLLRVVGEAEDIFDPDTGALIGRVPGRMKGTLEVVSYFGQDGAVAIVHSGGAFKENDRVEIY